MSNKQRKYSVPKTKTEDDDHDMTPDYYPWPSFPHDHSLFHNNRRVPNNHLARSIPTTYIINKVKHLKFKKRITKTKKNQVRRIMYSFQIL